MSESRRIALSLNRAQTIWLERLMAVVRRGGDTRDLIRKDEATVVAGVVSRAAKRAALITPFIGRTMHKSCRNGHEYTPENTKISGVGVRRCFTCTRAASKRASEKRRIASAQKHVAAAMKVQHEQVCDRMIEERERGAA